MISIECEYCGDEYWAERSSRKYCSNSCKTLAYRRRKIEKQQLEEELIILKHKIKLERMEEEEENVRRIQLAQKQKEEEEQIRIQKEQKKQAEDKKKAIENERKKVEKEARDAENEKNLQLKMIGLAILEKIGPTLIENIFNSKKRPEKPSQEENNNPFPFPRSI